MTTNRKAIFDTNREEVSLLPSTARKRYLHPVVIQFMYRDSKKPQQTQNTMLFEPHSSHENPKSLPSSAPSNFTPSMELPDPQHYRPVLAAALRMADKAVSLDSEKNYDGAIVAYADTLKLIECILERPGMDAVRDKLIGTVRGYILFRLESLFLGSKGNRSMLIRHSFCHSVCFI